MDVWKSSLFIGLFLLSSCEEIVSCKADGHVAQWNGSCVDDQASGYGTAIFENEYKRSITGHFKDGIPNGHVKIEYSRGGTYQGGMQGGHFHGYGKWITDFGDGYEGHWDEGHLSGEAVYTTKDGVEIPGFWKRGSSLLYARYIDKNQNCEVWWAPEHQYPRGATYWDGECVMKKPMDLAV